MPLTLYIIGDGEKRAELEELVKTMRLDGCVFLLGHIENASVYLKAFDIFLLPSVTEALGYVLLEAGLAEIPVIASNIGGIPEIIKHDRSGLLVAPRDAAGIANAVEFLAAHPADARRLARNLHQTVTKRFSFASMIQKTVGIYQF